MKTLWMLAALASASAWGADFRPEDFGARADGSTLDTAAIQAAIDRAAGQGGTVVLSKGTYLSGSVFVKSGVTLRIDKDATLRGSQRLQDYPVMPTRIAGIETSWPAALVNVYREHNASITGEGTIDGDGKVFWQSFWDLRKAYEPRGLRWAADYDAQRPRLVQVYDARDVKLGGGLLLKRAGFWTVQLVYSDGVTVDGVTIRNNEDGKGPSTDGIDIDSSRNVLVQHADISVNDDALCLKAGRDSDGLRVNRPTENVVIRDVLVREGAAGVTFGSETSGGFRNIEAYNITVEGRVPVGILFKSAHTRGGLGQDIRLHDIKLNNIPVVFRVTMNWNPSYSYARIPDGIDPVPPIWKVLATPVPRERGMARLRDVQVWNIEARGARTVFEVEGFPEAPLERFSFSKLDIQAEQGGSLRYVRDWKFSDNKIQLTGSPVQVAPESSVTGL
ncbi:glycoside hydrolase family 28 protein [Massilia sp. TS11]|uniref:glycoside hydrolase family 28 protein n=1 Tax=Massilia sp. TS11 TaxID=2908003 RepID=UPI001EDA9898|nr:glycosyl hydrolase family 28 protein [Massilia sp. TS11]MCG2583931.1 glycosyl hydrolase family 28 protein [Massilia sp. TS11]